MQIKMKGQTICLYWSYRISLLKVLSNKIKQMKNKMKNVAVVALLLLAQFDASAQENKDTKGFKVSRIGLKGGVNFTNLYTDDADKEKMLFGFNAGLFAKLPITSFIAIQPELYFITKGAEVTYNNPFVQGAARFRYNYLELPILVVVNVNENFNLQAGPYAAFMLSGDVKNQSSTSLFDFEKNINTDDYNRFEFGLCAGAGIDIGAIGLGARYSYGINKVGKESTYLGTTTYTFPDAHNGVISLFMTLSLN